MAQRSSVRASAVTPTAESVRPSREPAGSLAEGGRPAQLRAWRRLRAVAIVLPVAFIVGLQLLRPFVSADPLPDTGEALLDVVTAVAAIVFGLVIFRSIDRWHEMVLRSNRELAVRDAVATALRDASRDDVPVAAVRSVRDATGASDVVLDLASGARFDALGPLEPMPGSSGRGGAGRGAEMSGTDMRGAEVRDVLWEAADEVTSTVEVPLDAAGTPVGVMRVTLPSAVGLSPAADGVLERRAEVLTSATAVAIGQQIGSAIHRAELLARLERALDRQRAVSELLVVLTSGLPLEEGLCSVVAAAARLTGAQDAGLHLDPAAVPALHPHPGAQAVHVDADTVTICDDAGDDLSGAAAAEGATATACAPDGTYTAAVRGPHGPLGRLWVSPRGAGALPRTGVDQHAADQHAVDQPEADRRESGTVLADLAELASVAVEHARLLEDERGAAAAREREWIAREMHDSLAQVLGVLHLRLRSLETLLGAVPTQDAQRETSDLADIAHDAFVDVREAILGLRVSTAGDRSFLDALRSYAQKYERQSGVATSVAELGHIELTPAAEVQMLRVVQEALTNVRKHAHASRALVRVTQEDASVRVTVQDDGTGFDPATAGRFDSFGMSSMRERTEAVGGRFDVISGPGGGTCISALVPSAAHATTPPIVHPEVRAAR